MESNEILDKLPKHLLSLVIDQPYNEYTPQDHAIWRYVMRQNVRYLSKVAHHSYLEGLRKTGISIEQIPHMYGMNRILREIGWAAVAVDGFIPPAAFMEFQAYHVLVIAADIRPADQIEYTPAPDIIHEAAGHAPIIANDAYAQYLIRFGELGSKAFSSARDFELYEAIRHLSIVKADPYSSKEDIENAVIQLLSIEKSMGKPSEMALIRNLHWWTVEYGLIGDLANPRIYGAGLLSSIGESWSALNNGVKKIPYTLEAMNTGFDITTKQPQLFVTPDFDHLSVVLEDFANTMALKTGGMDGISKAIGSKNTATCVYSSGLQVSGTFTEVIEKNGEPIYLRTGGPSCLSFQNKVISGQGKDHHAHGFGSPVGELANPAVPLELLSDGELEKLGIIPHEHINLVFESGIKVNAYLERILRCDGKILLMVFKDCSVTYGDEKLYLPEWGTYDMAVGEKIVSAFSGPADPEAFGLNFRVPSEKTHKIEHSPEARKLHQKYQETRDIREMKSGFQRLDEIWEETKRDYSDDWLLSLEILEILHENRMNDRLKKEVMEYLEHKKETHPELRKLISNGLESL